MTIFRRSDAKQLIEHDAHHCVSIFLPTHYEGPEVRQDPIRLKNLTTAAVDQLIERGLRRPDAEAIVAPVRTLMKDDEFWRRRSDGLACFCAADLFQVYRVPMRLEEELFVDNRFHLKPLAPLLHANARFYILALSQEDARLFESTRYTTSELALPEIALAELDGAEQPHQYHSHQAPTQGKGGTTEAIHHGHGGADDRTKVDALQFFHRVDRAVTDVLGDDKAPLVLACVEFLAPIYAEANTYKHLFADIIPGSPNGRSMDEFRARAWELIEPAVRQEEQRSIDAFQQNRASGRASDDIGEVVLAAQAGRVEALLVEQGARQAGRVDPQAQQVQLATGEQDGNVELLDYAVNRTLANGGKVHVVEDIPESQSPLAATFRY